MILQGMIVCEAKSFMYQDMRSLLLVCLWPSPHVLLSFTVGVCVSVWLDYIVVTKASLNCHIVAVIEKAIKALYILTPGYTLDSLVPRET